MLMWIAGSSRRGQRPAAEGNADTADSSAGAITASSNSMHSEPQSEDEGGEGHTDELEDFLSWVKRVTGFAEAELSKLHIEDLGIAAAA